MAGVEITVNLNSSNLAKKILRSQAWRDEQLRRTSG